MYSVRMAKTLTAALSSTMRLFALGIPLLTSSSCRVKRGKCSHLPKITRSMSLKEKNRAKIKHFFGTRAYHIAASRNSMNGFYVYKSYLISGVGLLGNSV